MPRAVFLVTDRIYSKTSRYVEKLKSLLDPADEIRLAIVEGFSASPEDFFRLPHVQCISGVVSFLAAEMRNIATHLQTEPLVVALNQSAVIPAIGIMRQLGQKTRNGLVEACSKTLTRQRLKATKELALAFYECLPGSFLPADPEFCAQRYVVKPSFGMSSYDVKVYDSWHSAINHATDFRYTKQWIPENVFSTLQLSGVRTDAKIIEPYIDGVEFSIDGWIHDGLFWAIVQHKLYMNTAGSFIGDGTTVSPPIADQSILPSGCLALNASEEEICNFGRKILEALHFTSGVFHIEAREQADTRQLKLIEVNPRAPGGSLWKSALFRTGYDLELVDAAIQLGLPIPHPGMSDTVSRSRCVLHHPFYATSPGQLKSWGKLTEVVKTTGGIVHVDYAVDLNHCFSQADMIEEPYLAFAVGKAKSVEELLAMRRDLLRLEVPKISI